MSVVSPPSLPSFLLLECHFGTKEMFSKSLPHVITPAVGFFMHKNNDKIMICILTYASETKLKTTDVVAQWIDYKKFSAESCFEKQKVVIQIKDNRLSGVFIIVFQLFNIRALLLLENSVLYEFGWDRELIISGTFFALSYSKRDLGCL